MEFDSNLQKVGLMSMKGFSKSLYFCLIDVQGSMPLSKKLVTVGKLNLSWTTFLEQALKLPLKTQIHKFCQVSISPLRLSWNLAEPLQSV